MSARNAGGGGTSGNVAAGAAARAGQGTRPLKRGRGEDTAVVDSVPDSSGGGGGGSGAGMANGPATDSTGPQKRQAPAHDPAPFECPCDAAEYDCQKRAPARSACACKRLLCRKCAGVVASLPHAAACDLCGALDQGPFEVADFPRDVGVLATLMAKLPSPATLCVGLLRHVWADGSEAVGGSYLPPIPNAHSLSSRHHHALVVCCKPAVAAEPLAPSAPWRALISPRSTAAWMLPAT
jgi:hypothetical protein